MLRAALLALGPAAVAAVITAVWWRRRGAHAWAVGAAAFAAGAALGPAAGIGAGLALSAMGVGRNADVPVGLIGGFLVGMPLGSVAGAVLGGMAAARWLVTPVRRRWALGGCAAGVVCGWPLVVLLPRGWPMDGAGAAFLLACTGGAAAVGGALERTPAARRRVAMAAGALAAGMAAAGWVRAPALRGAVQTVQELAQAGDTAALRAVIERPGETDWARGQASRAYAALDPTGALGAGDRDTRYRAAIILGESRDPRALPVLLEGAADGRALGAGLAADDSERARLIRALGAYDDPGAVACVAALLAGGAPRGLLPAAMDAAGDQGDGGHLAALRALVGSPPGAMRWRAGLALSRVALATGDAAADRALAGLVRSRDMYRERRDAAYVRAYWQGGGYGAAPRGPGPAPADPTEAQARATPNAAEILRTVRALDLGCAELTRRGDMAGLARIALGAPEGPGDGIRALQAAGGPAALSALRGLERSGEVATARRAEAARERLEARAAEEREASRAASAGARGGWARLAGPGLVVQGRHRGLTAIAVVVRGRSGAARIGCVFVSRSTPSASDVWGYGAGGGGSADGEQRYDVEAQSPALGRLAYSYRLPAEGPATETLTVNGSAVRLERGRALVAGGGGAARQAALPAADGLDWRRRPDACLRRTLDLLLEGGAVAGSPHGADRAALGDPGRR